MQPTVLVLRALNLGDLLVSVPALRGLRRRYPEHRIVLAAPGGLRPLVNRIDAVDELLPHQGLEPPGVVSPPDVAVDLHGVPPDSVRALLAIQPGRLVAFACPEAGHADGPTMGEVEHEAAKWCRLVAWDGAQCDRADVLIDPPAGVASPRPGATVVHPGAQYGSKRWPADRFAAVARALAGGGHDVVITGSERERSVALEVAEAAGLDADVAVLAGSTDLAELLALVAGARLVVANDTGVSHLAVAYERPSVTLFGPASPRIWGPPPKPCHAVLWHGTEERETLTDETDPTLLAITVDEVLCAIADLRT